MDGTCVNAIDIHRFGTVWLQGLEVCVVWIQGLEVCVVWIQGLEVCVVWIQGGLPDYRCMRLTRID